MCNWFLQIGSRLGSMCLVALLATALHINHLIHTQEDAVSLEYLKSLHERHDEWLIRKEAR